METPVIKSIANALSTITILSCLFLKVPQIKQVKQRRSAEGIFPQSMIMEITGFTIMTLYNFTNGYSILTYLEYPIILVQVYILLYYVLMYKRMLNKSTIPVYVGTYVLIAFAFICGCLPKVILSYLVPFCTPLSGFAKVTYIYSMIAESNADAVSLTTWIISIATNMARIFTVYVDSADVTLLINFSVSTLLSAAVFGTAFYYQSMSCDCTEKKQRRTTAKPHKDFPTN